MKLRNFRVSLDNFSSRDKKIFLILAAVEILLIVLICLFSVILLFNNRATSQLQTMPTAVYQNSNSQRFLPIIENQVPSVIPSSTPKAFGHTWTVTEIEESVLLDSGLTSDVATFTNLDNPSVIMKAYCIDPGWPSPAIGSKYSDTETGDFLPIDNNDTSTFQRFHFIDD